MNQLKKFKIIGNNNKDYMRINKWKKKHLDRRLPKIFTNIRKYALPY